MGRLPSLRRMNVFLLHPLHPTQPCTSCNTGDMALSADVCVCALWKQGAFVPCQH